MAEWLKAPVLKTGSVRALAGSNPALSSLYNKIFCAAYRLSCLLERSQFKNTVCVFFTEKYSRGRRGAPAKGVGRETGARVQIPPSPPTIPSQEGEAEISQSVGFAIFFCHKCSTVALQLLYCIFFVSIDISNIYHHFDMNIS